jgi:hypothetical protein
MWKIFLAPFWDFLEGRRKFLEFLASLDPVIEEKAKEVIREIDNLNK